MKKILSISLSTLLVFSFIYSCSSDEEAPPPNIVQTPASETPTPTQYTLTVSAGEGGSVSSEGGTYESGTQISVTASPNLGYIFSGWSNGSTSSTITITMEDSINLTSEFYLTNVELVSKSKISYDEISDLQENDINAVLSDASASTHYFFQNGNEVLLIGPVDQTDLIGERPMKQFIKSDNEWVFSREYIEFQDGGPRDIDGFENGNYAFASHGLEPSNRPAPLGYLWHVSNIGSEEIDFKKVSNYKGFWHSVAVGDLNYDGLEDIVSVQMGSEIFSEDPFPFHIYLATDTSNYTHINSDDFIDKSDITFPSGGSIEIHDLDSDGSIDIILGAYAPHVYDAPLVHESVLGEKFGIEVYSDTDRDGIYELQRDYSFPLGSFNFPNVGSTKIEVDDIDGDGDNDIIVYFEGNRDPNETVVESCLIDLFLNDGSRSFSVSNIMEKPFVEKNGREFRLVDLDGDNQKDIVLNIWQLTPAFSLNNDLIIGEIDINSGNGLFNFSPMIYKSNAGEFQMESRVFRYPIENLASTFFKAYQTPQGPKIFAFTTNDDNLTISEFQLIY